MVQKAEEDNSSGEYDNQLGEWDASHIGSHRCCHSRRGGCHRLRYHRSRYRTCRYCRGCRSGHGPQLRRGRCWCGVRGE